MPEAPQPQSTRGEAAALSTHSRHPSPKHPAAKPRQPEAPRGEAAGYRGGSSTSVMIQKSSLRFRSVRYEYGIVP